MCLRQSEQRLKSLSVTFDDFGEIYFVILKGSSLRLKAIPVNGSTMNLHEITQSTSRIVIHQFEVNQPALQMELLKVHGFVNKSMQLTSPGRVLVEVLRKLPFK